MTLPTDPSWLWRLWTQTQETRPERSRLWCSENIHNWHCTGWSVWFSWLLSPIKMINQVSIKMSTIRISSYLAGSGSTFSSHLTNVSLVPDTSQRQPPWLWEHYIPTSEIWPGYLILMVSPDTGWHSVCYVNAAQCNDQSRVAGLCLCLGREWCWR